MNLLHKPFFSIITINLNNKVGLKKTISSVVNQSFKDYEYIVIDGKSTDGSINVIEEYSNGIFHWESKLDKGIFHAMNKGIEKANGSYVLFLNSGDIITSETSLEKVVDKIQNSSSDIFYFDIFKSYTNGKIIYHRPNIKVQFSIFVKGSIPHSGGSIIRKCLFKELGYYQESYRIISDWEWFIRAFLADKKFEYIPDIPLSFYDMTGISETNREQNEIERKLILDKYQPLLVDAKELICYKRRERKLIYKIIRKLYRPFQID